MVFSIGVMGILVLFLNTLGKTSDPLVRLQGIQTVQAVMETVSLKKFDNSTPEGGGAVPLDNVSIGNDGEIFDNYNDIDDFVNECGTKKSFTSKQFGLKDNYEVYIKVEYAQIDASNNIVNTCNDAVPENKKYKFITIELKNDNIGETYTLKRLKGNF